MAELSPQTTSSDPVYKPLSALAVTGFLVSCVFALIVVVSAGLALAQGAPFFFPSWVLLVAVAGFLLSYGGASDVRSSEGVKAGAKLASWGMGLSLVCGLGYFAYSYMTEQALQYQTHAFLTVADEDSGFFPRLQKAGKDKVELHRAYLLTLPAFDRGGARPEDEARMKFLHDQPTFDGMPGKLTRFRQHGVVETIIEGGDQVEIEKLGLQEWKYENRSYQISRRYRIHAPEMALDVLLTVKSSEAEAEGQSRTWFVDLSTAQMLAQNRTTKGQALLRLRSHANSTLEKLHQKIQTGDKLADFPQVDKTDWGAIHIDGKISTDLKAALPSVFAGTFPKGQWYFRLNMDQPGLWPAQQDAQGHVTIDIPFATVLNTPQEQVGVETIVQMRTRAPVDLERIAASDSAEDVPAWDVVGVKFVRAMPTKQR